jgi:hypothetical protein
LQAGLLSAVGYTYINCAQALLEPESNQTIKIPQIAKKEHQDFLTSTYDKAGLKGPPTGI